jgi:fatty acid desaturase
MHDASHTAIGPNEYYWKFLGRLTHDWYVGGSMISWHHQHIIGHHQYTNVFLADPDIPYRVDGDLRRIVGDQSWVSVYKWQWLYLPILYAFLALKVRVSDITDTWLARTSGPMRVNFYDSVLIRIFAVKGSWIFWRTVLPLMYLPITWQKYWALWLITEFTSGLWLAWNFEVSHLAPEALFPDIITGEEAASLATKKSAQAANAVKYAPGQKVVPKSWVVTQIESSVDYGHDSPLTTWWCGALNYQIEHHLFPGISQYHYPALAPIVKEFCRENNIRYNYEPTFVAAWLKHVKLLVDMGEKGFAYKWD